MRKILLGIATLLTVGASAQLTYVRTVSLENLIIPMRVGYSKNLIDNNKFLIGQQSSYEFDILNPDFTIYKSVSIDTTGWGVLGYRTTGMFFSDHLLNSDDKVEITYSIGYEDPAQDNYWVTVKTVVIDEDGVELQSINNGGYAIDSENFVQTDDKTYLMSWSNFNDDMKIYEAAGTLPCKSCSSTEATPTQKAPEKIYDINVFPNPTTNQITLAINTDKTGMKVHIYSTDGKLVKSASVMNGNNLIDTADLVSGTYIYNVQTDTEVIHASQFIKK